MRERLRFQRRRPRPILALLSEVRVVPSVWTHPPDYAKIVAVFKSGSSESTVDWNSLRLTRLRIAAIVFVASFLLAFPHSAQPTPSADAAAGCAELKPGVVVESVAKNSEGEKAGLLDGDIILSWSQGDVKGQIGSPFGLSEVETEQEPRGRVTLEGSRSGTTQTWVIGPDKWGIQARPDIPPAVLRIYLEGQELAKAAKFTEAADRWRAAAAKGEPYSCVWLSSWILFHAAERLADAQQWKESEALFQIAIQRGADAGPGIKAQLLRSWARTYQLRDKLETAEKYYRQAGVELTKTGPESLAAARNLNDLGKILDDGGAIDKAERCQTDALEVQRRLAPGSLDVALSLNYLGISADESGDQAKAEIYYRQALDIREKLAPESLSVAATIDNLAIVDRERGDLASAEEYHLQSLAIRQRLAPGSMDVARSLGNLGNVANDRGDLRRAEKYYQQSLAISQILTPGSLGVAIIMNNMGDLLQQRGDLAGAEKYYLQSLSIYKKLAPGSSQVALMLGNLGNLSLARGDISAAEEYQRLSLAIREKVAPASLDVALGLNNLAAVLENRGDFVGGEMYYLQSLAIYERLGPGSIDEAECVNNLGTIAYDLGDFAKAEAYYRRALAIREKLAPGSLDVAESLFSLGNVTRDRKDVTTAALYYRQSLTIWKNLSPKSQQYAESLAALAGMLQDKQQSDEAIHLYGEAIDVLDNQMVSLGGSSDVRAGFRAKHRDYYLDYADLLVKRENPDLAFQVIEQSRARTLLELLGEARVDIREGAPPALLDQERVLQATLTAKTNRKISLLEDKHSEEQLTDVNKEIAEVLEQYQEVEGQIRSSSPAYAALTQPKPLSAREVQQQLLGADTVLLEYALGEKRSYLFIVTPTSIDAYELPKRAEIQETAHHVYELLTSRNHWIKGETSLQRMGRIARDEA